MGARSLDAHVEVRRHRLAHRDDGEAEQTERDAPSDGDLEAPHQVLPSIAKSAATLASSIMTTKSVDRMTEDVIARVSVLADDLPGLRSLELNPVVVSEHGAVVLGARATLAPADRADSTRRLSRA